MEKLKMWKKKAKNGEGQWASAFSGDSKVTAELRKLTNSPGWVAASRKILTSEKSQGSSGSSTPSNVSGKSSKKNKKKKEKKKEVKKKFKMVLEKDEEYEIDYVSPEEDENTEDSESEFKPISEGSDNDLSMDEDDADEISSIDGSIQFEEDYSDLELDEDAPTLELPESSRDLLIPKHLVLTALGVYETLRHFRSLLRLSPMLFEDFCSAFADEDTNVLMTECYIAVLKAIVREEDAAATQFGPPDQKDSRDSAFSFLDYITWPEVVRGYLDSTREHDGVLEIVKNPKFPRVGVEDKILVLKTLTDIYLASNKVRDKLMTDGVIQYDDHCRACHKLGDLLCCETCPAVYHLACCDPPLADIPDDEWQCEICIAHKLNGVYNCEPKHELQGQYLRHDPLGVDRHGRKYWFLVRRLIVEGTDNVWYYSTCEQFELVRSLLDPDKYEIVLCEALKHLKEDFYKFSQITYSITEESLPDSKTVMYLQSLKNRIKREQEEKIKKAEEERKKREREKKKMEEERKKKEDEKKKLEEEERIKNEEKVKKEDALERKEAEIAVPQKVDMVLDSDAPKMPNHAACDDPSKMMNHAANDDPPKTVQIPDIVPKAEENTSEMPSNSVLVNNVKSEVLTPDGPGVKSEPKAIITSNTSAPVSSSQPTPQKDAQSTAIINSSGGSFVNPPPPKTVVTPTVAAPAKNIQVIKLASKNLPLKGPGSGNSQLKTLFVLNKDGTKTQITLGTSGKITPQLSGMTAGANRQILVFNSAKVALPKLSRDLKKIDVGVKLPESAKNQNPGAKDTVSQLKQMTNQFPMPAKPPVQIQKKMLTHEEEAELHFKLGEDKGYQQYVNHYTENTLALNKYQHKEERDRERYLSYKFSLSDAGEFKWMGETLGKESLMLDTLRNTLLHLEHQIPLCFMHTKWSRYRNAWGKIVLSCNTPQAFAAALGILEMATRVVVKRSIWRNSHGLPRLKRVTTAEKEDWDKKRKHRTRAEEEESNRNAIWCKYPFPIKCTLVWKVRGEEYRMTGYGGWIWVSNTRTSKLAPAKPKPYSIIHADAKAVSEKDEVNPELPELSPMKKPQLPGVSDVESDSEKSASTTSTTTTKSADLTDEPGIYESLIHEATDQSNSNPIVSSSSSIVNSNSDITNPPCVVKTEPMDVVESHTDLPVSSTRSIQDACDEIIDAHDVINISENLGKRTALYRKKWDASKLDVLLGWRKFQRDGVKVGSSEKTSAISPDTIKNSNEVKTEAARKTEDTSSTAANHNSVTNSNIAKTSSSVAMETDDTVKFANDPLTESTVDTTVKIDGKNESQPQNRHGDQNDSGSVEKCDAKPPVKIETEEVQCNFTSKVTSAEEGKLKEASVLQNKAESSDIQNDVSKIVEANLSGKTVTDETTDQKNADSSNSVNASQGEGASSSSVPDNIKNETNKGGSTLTDSTTPSGDETCSSPPKSVSLAQNEINQSTLVPDNLKNDTNSVAPPCDEKTSKSINSVNHTLKENESPSDVVKDMPSNPNQDSCNSGETEIEESDTSLMPPAPDSAKCSTSENGSSGISSSVATEGQSKPVKHDDSCSNPKQMKDEPKSCLPDVVCDNEMEVEVSDASFTASENGLDCDSTLTPKLSDETSPSVDVQDDMEVVSVEDSLNTSDTIVETTKTIISDGSQSVTIEKTSTTTVTKMTTVTTTISSMSDPVVTSEVSSQPFVSDRPEVVVTLPRIEFKQGKATVVSVQQRTKVSRMSRARRFLYKRPVGPVFETQKVWKLQRYRKTSSTLKKEKAMKLPLPWKFCVGKQKTKSIFRLPSTVVRKLAVSGGQWAYRAGFTFGAKWFSGLEQFWMYPCPRPTFSLTWRYKLQNVTNYASVAFLLRMFWHVIKWDKMTLKPQTDDVVHTVTTDDEIVTTELLKRKDNMATGLHSEYFIRKITMPILDPEEEALRAIKPAEGYTPSRKGLRNRRSLTLRDRPRKDSEPRVQTIWVPEEQVELWQIRQFDTMLKQQSKLASSTQIKVTAGQTGSILQSGANTFIATPSGGILPTLQNIRTKPENEIAGAGFSIVKLPLAQNTQMIQKSFGSSPSPQGFLGTKTVIGRTPPVQKFIVQSSNQQFSPYKPGDRPSAVIRSTPASSAQYIVQGGKLVKPIFIKPGPQMVSTASTQSVNRVGEHSFKYQQPSSVKKAPSVLPKTQPPINQTQIKLSSAQLAQLLKAGSTAPVKVSVSIGPGRTGIGQIQLIPPGSQVTPTSGQQLMQAKVGGETRRFLFTLISEATSAVAAAPPPAVTPAASSPVNEHSLRMAPLSQRLQQIQRRQLLGRNLNTDMKRLMTDKDPLWGSKPHVPDRPMISPSSARSSVPTPDSDRPKKKPLSRLQREAVQRHTVVTLVMKSILDRIDKKEEQEVKKKKREEALMRQRERQEQLKVHSRQTQFLHKHRDILKQEILKRKAIVEKYLTLAVKNDLQEDQRKRRNGVQYGSVSKKAKKSQAKAKTTNTLLNGNVGKKATAKKQAPKRHREVSSPLEVKKQKMINTSQAKTKEQELYCTCKTPYDSTRFYIGCDLCLNWFHGSCVGIPETRAKHMSEWICYDCQKAKEEPAQELYCICRTPYDDSKFYIGCDICQDWYHGSCVGVSEANADDIDYYACPKCKSKNQSESAALQENQLSRKDIAELTKVINSLRAHKMSWPFLQPVSKVEVPSYYKIIKKPMDLGTVLQKLPSYNMLSELMGDVSLIFDNCRMFNGADSALAKCAEILESLFVGKMRQYRLKRKSL